MREVELLAARRPAAVAELTDAGLAPAGPEQPGVVGAPPAVLDGRLDQRRERGERHGQIEDPTGERGTQLAEVDVLVDDPRQHRSSAQLDDAGRGADEGGELGVPANRDNPSVADRDRLRATEGGVDGHDVAAAEQQVGGVVPALG